MNDDSPDSFTDRYHSTSEIYVNKEKLCDDRRKEHILEYG
jgi:hypothetical protein